MEETKPTLVIAHVDDAVDYLKDYSRIFLAHPLIRSLHQATDAEEGLRIIHALKPDIAFLDIEMPGKDGLWLANEIKHTNTAIVFLTNHDDHAIKAFQLCALHYIIKPLSMESLEDLIERFLTQQKFIQYQPSQIEELQKINKDSEVGAKRIFINTHKEIKVLQIDELIYAKAEGAYTEFLLKSGEKVKSSRNLKSFHTLVGNNPDLIRVNRSYLINQAFLDHVDKRQNGYIINFTNGVKIEVSNIRMDSLLIK